MKKLITGILLMLPILSFAQNSTNCSDYINEIYDQGVVIYTTRPVFSITESGSSTWTTFTAARDSSIIMSINIVGETRCFKENTEVLFVFTDGTTLEFNSYCSYNCKGNLTMWLGLYASYEKNLSTLRSKFIKYIMFPTVDPNYFVKAVYTKEEATQFKNTLTCICALRKKSK